MNIHSTTRYPEVNYTFLGHGGATLEQDSGGFYYACDCGDTFPVVGDPDGGYESPAWVAHARSHRRRLLRLRPDEVALAETLLTALRETNRLGGYHERQHGGSYGAIKTALVTTLACAILGSANEFFFDNTRKIAERLYDEAIDNGESIQWQIDLYNEGVI